MSYYSIEDLLAEEHETQTHLHTTAWSNPEGDVPFFSQFQSNSVVSIPMWLAYDLQKREYSTPIVPSFLHVKGLSTIINNSQANLAGYSPYFYHLGFKILNAFSQINQNYREILSMVLKRLFLTRFREQLVPQADTRGLKSVSMSFLESLPELERELFKALEHDFSTFHRWRTAARKNKVEYGNNKKQRR